MKIFFKLPIYSYSISVITTLMFAISFATLAFADIRHDAESAYTVLHQNPAINKFADDVQSLDLVFDIAERYQMVGEQENADRFYLLALQKSLIIEEMIKVSNEQVQVLPEYIEQKNSIPDDLSSIEPNSKRIVGKRGVYTVVKGDTLRLVAAKLGVSQQQLRNINGFDNRTNLKIGQKITYNNRKIIPQRIKNGIIVNIPDRTLYYFQRGLLVTSLPVALGSVMKNEKYVWQTPVGKFRVTDKIKDPTWTVPSSIQSEMEEKGKEVLTTVSPGPKNPLGKYAIKTSIPGILIHSTIKPSSIYSYSSHGCIRVSPDQMEGFFPKIKINTKGEIIYKPVKLAVTENGRVFLEVHRDIYRRSADLVAEAKKMVEKQKLSDLVDWGKFKSVLKNKSGVAEDITL